MHRSRSLDILCPQFVLVLIFTCVVSGQAQNLQSQQLDEVVDSLSKYDINDDGILSQEEINVAQPHIQKLLDRYAELKAQEDLEQENADETRSPASQNAHISDHDDDDGVEIEVEDDMEVKEDVKEDIKSANKLSYFAAGLATLITVIYLSHKWRSTQQQRIQEEADLHALRREAWLSRMSKGQHQSVPPSSSLQESSTGEVSETLVSSTSSSVKSVMAAAKNNSVQKTNGVPEGISKDQSFAPQKSAKGSLLSSESSKNGAAKGSKITHSGQIPIAKSSGDFQNEVNNITMPSEQDSFVKKIELKSSDVPLPAAPKEKTSDKEKTIKFLEDVLSCTVILEKEDKIRTRFSLKKLTVAGSQFPCTVGEVHQKMAAVVHHVFVKQINKVSFSISVYNACNEYAASYNDKMVDATSSVIKKKALETILSYFENECAGAVSLPAEDLWSSDGKFSLESFEAAQFLPRLVGAAKDGIFVSQSMLTDLLMPREGQYLLLSLFQAGGSLLTRTKRLDELVFCEGTTLNALELLATNPHCGGLLSILLDKEIREAAKHSLGNYFEHNSVLAPLLSLSTIPTTGAQRTFVPHPSASIPFKSLRSYPRLTSDDISSVESMIQRGIHKTQQIVYAALKRVVSNKTTREIGLAWMASVVGLNELRTAAVLQDSSDIQPGCSDGFMLNLCAVLLEFFLPISSDNEKLLKVDLSYSSSSACRLNYDFETCLAGGQIVCEKGQERRLGILPPELQGQQTFITECFHLTQRALSVGIIPAIKHYNNMHRFFSSQTKVVQGTEQEEVVKNMHLLVTVVWDTCLLDTELARNITIFYISQARLLLEVIKTEEKRLDDPEMVACAQRKALSVVPEFCVKDMAQWFRFLAGHVLRLHPNTVKGLDLVAFVDCCVMLLERPDLMPGPIPASQTVSALLSFLGTKAQNGPIMRGGWGSGVMSDLEAMVHTCPSVQEKLGPALLRTYVSVDVVEGLDVDKDTFDKYGARVEIGELLKRLWFRIDCRSSIIRQCGTELFQSFLNAILDTLLYMLHDSLSRLANVKKIEALKANNKDWSALTPGQQAEKERFLRNEESVGTGFMHQAKTTLNLLDLITQSEKVSHCFTQQPLASRAASTINGFLESLCGAKAKDFKVKNMAKYNFNPGELLSTIVNIIVRVTMQDHSVHNGYLVSMVKDPDFELHNVEKALSVIQEKGLGGEAVVSQMSDLVRQMKTLMEENNSIAPVTSQGDEEGNWMEAFVDTEVDHDALEKDYVTTMQNERFSSAKLQESHSFHGNLQALEPRSPKVKALMKEMKQLQQNLPVHADASIFVLQDEERMDVMRALITGPTGTPYSLGCFCFDIYFPTNYPNVPPLVKIITTGKGTVRFNPNLYADGKVCLSLLGTWHAGDASEKWNPSASSLYQVLVSIQSMILTPDPVFNEPGYERLKDTEEGEIQSRQYNWKLHLNTLRHAVLGQLREPPPGFERLIGWHFALQREALLKQCAQWVHGCEDQDLLKRMRQTADNIFEELMRLDVDFSVKDEDTSDDDKEEE